jgi:ribosomal-protein-alanine N-acetyltransferase
MNLPSPQFCSRPMSATDIQHVLEIAAQLTGAPDWAATAYVRAIDPANASRRIALVAAHPQSDIPAGFLVASLLEPEAELETIAVAGVWQHRGIGGLLLKVLLEELGKEEVTGLHLEVRASNQTALRFYLAHGFRETGRRPRYYVDPEEDAVLMKLDLPPVSSV